MINQQIKRADNGQRSAKKKHLQVEMAERQGNVQDEDDHDRYPPASHVFTAKAVTQGNWFAGRKLDGVGKTIGQVNKTGREKEKNPHWKIKLRTENVREKPLPRD